MARIELTPNLARHGDFRPGEAPGETVAAILAHFFSAQPTLKGYVLDDQGRLRKHMVVFVDGRAIRDRASLSDAVSPNSEVYIMQALSGG